MNEFSREHTQAFLLSSLITLGLAAALAWFVLGPQTLRQLFEGTPSPASPITSSVIKDGEAYVKTLPTYEPEKERPVLFFESTKAGDNVWILAYSSLGTLDGLEVRYDYNVFWQDGRIISHEIRVNDIPGLLSVSSPEPQQILSDGRVTVTGKAKPVQSVTVALRDQQDTTRVFAETRIAAREDGTFTAILDVPAQARASVIVVDTADSELRIPVIFDHGLYAPRN